MPDSVHCTDLQFFTWYKSQCAAVWPWNSSDFEDFFFFCIWLAVHQSITFLLLPTSYTNFLFIYTNYIKLNSCTCFERIPPIMRRSTTQIVHKQPLVSSLSAGDGLVQSLRKDLSPSLVVAEDSHLQRVTIPEAAYVQFASLTSWWWAECARNMYRNLIWCNLCKWTRNLCINLVIIKKLLKTLLFVHAV
jgi:hypothetical protein